MKANINQFGIAVIIVMSGILLPSVLLSTTVNAQNNTKEQLTVALSQPGKSFTLAVNIKKGAVRVTQGEGKEIEVDIEQEQKKSGKGQPNQNINTNTNVNININIHQPKEQRLPANGGKYLSIQENNNTVNIKQTWTQAPLNVVVRLPRGATPQRITINGSSDISVVNIKSEMEINTSGGAVSLAGISGSVIANTVNGNITAHFKSADSGAPMAFSTLGGNIDISFPSTLKASVKLKSDNGSIHTDFHIEQDKQHPEARPNPERNKNPGNLPGYKLNNSGWVYGKINEGGAEIMMRNVSGNISIRKTK